MLLEYMENVDDKLFKEYSKGKNFNSFINEFDRATKEENKETVVKEVKDINSFVEHYAQMEDDYPEYKNKLFDIINAVDYFVYEYSKKWASDGICETKSPSKEQVNKYKMTKREIYKRFTNLSKQKLNTKNI